MPVDSERGFNSRGDARGYHSESRFFSSQKDVTKSRLMPEHAHRDGKRNRAEEVLASPPFSAFSDSHSGTYSNSSPSSYSSRSSISNSSSRTDSDSSSSSCSSRSSSLSSK